MNYLDEQLKNALSAEFVLGTLQGRARQRYQRLLMEVDPLRKNVWQWEKHLNQLGSSLPKVKPESYVWENIQMRLGFETETTVETVKTPWWKPLLVPGFAAMAVFLATALWLLWSDIPQPVDLTERVAIVQNADAEALWLIEIQADVLKVQATAKLPQYSDKDYQLWMLAADGRAPVPLGILPQSGGVEIPRSALFNQLEIAALAVSLEPLGGSPNGSPTQVLFTTELVSM
ncbi:anti-sigma factor domain-containing protein [Marinicella sp. W31]|uniref:anti-sigma factor n=1 Tax=Marinicella sp. W31 TaxID=3023713 RepID=UPI0037578700